MSVDISAKFRGGNIPSNLFKTPGSFDIFLEGATFFKGDARIMLSLNQEAAQQLADHLNCNLIDLKSTLEKKHLITLKIV